MGECKDPNRKSLEILITIVTTLLAILFTLSIFVATDIISPVIYRITTHLLLFDLIILISAYINYSNYLEKILFIVSWILFFLVIICFSLSAAPRIRNPLNNTGIPVLSQLNKNSTVIIGGEKKGKCDCLLLIIYLLFWGIFGISVLAVFIKKLEEPYKIVFLLLLIIGTFLVVFLIYCFKI